VLAFSRNRRLLASGGAGRSGHLSVGYGSGIDVWDAFTGTAMGQLIDAPEHPVALLERVRPVQRSDPGTVARLITQLDSDTYAEREKAQVALEKMVKAPPTCSSSRSMARSTWNYAVGWKRCCASATRLRLPACGITAPSRLLNGWVEAMPAP
jgi:hypothetical protein